MPFEIEIIPSYKINKLKWDECICHSSNAIIYASSVYLDHMTDNWNGIVVNDYECVMPVPWRKKFGIRYCYDVPFIQQLGWFAKNIFPDASLLLKTLFRFCKYGYYPFNYDNKVTGEPSSACASNFVLSLNIPYAEIIKGYKQTLGYSLKKTSRHNLSYAEGNYKEAIDLYKKLYHHKFLHVREMDFNNFRNLCVFLFERNKIIARRVCNEEHEMLAEVVLINFENRLFNIINNISPEGRKTEANYFLFDNIFKEFAGSSFLFDFEGSDIPGIKSFYEKFGSVNQPYYELQFNHLPAIIKWLRP
ncbi:MAG TPA: hypothetical protein VH396_05280 [Chitinophagaceae bacterium]